MGPPLLAVLDDDDRRELVRVARRRRFARGDVIFHEGDPGDTMHIVTSGHVAIRVTTPLGDTAMLRIIGPGEHFGELALISPAPRSATVVALDKVETLSISMQQLEELRVHYPRAATVVAQSIVDEVRRLDTALTEALYVPSEKRLLRRLVDLTKAFGTETGRASVIPLTQEEIAQLAGVTRPTANRALKQAEAQGMVRANRGQVEILDIAALERRAR